MAYCNYCGKLNTDGSNFCTRCGNSVSSNRYNSVRREVFVGELRRCPSCNSDVSSFTSICPYCGHEFNNVIISQSLSSFTEMINNFDNQISTQSLSFTQRPTKGWNSWSKGKKFGWVVLNIYTICIPLVIYLNKSKIRIFMGNLSPELTSLEQRKVAYIDNYTIPNERESIIEFMLLAKSKVEALSINNVDEKNLFWINLWINKAKQAYDKALLILPNDSNHEIIFKKITDRANSIMNGIRLKSILPFIVELTSIVSLIIASLITY